MSDQRERLVDGGAVLSGAVAGLLLIAPVSVLATVLEREVDGFTDSGWQQVLVLGLFAAYFVAGLVAGREAPTAPFANGALAAMGAVALWVPLRILIWVLRSDDRGLVTGHDPVLTVGGLFGAIVAAAFFGMLGAWLRARRVHASTHGDDADAQRGSTSPPSSPN